jgi:hypothetical protein
MSGFDRWSAMVEDFIERPALWSFVAETTFSRASVLTACEHGMSAIGAAFINPLNEPIGALYD